MPANPIQKSKPYPEQILKGNKGQKWHRGQNLLQIALPLGGIGAGCICLNGYGGLQDFSIRNRPATTAMPDEYNGLLNTESAFAVLHLPAQGITRLVEGPLPVEKIYDQGLKSQGYRAGGHEGLPRFQDCSFKGAYPFGTVKLSDPQIPLSVQLTGFNPFIPLDDKNSGIPCAILEYTLHNVTRKPVNYEFSYHISHLAPGANEDRTQTSRNAVIPGVGAIFYNTEPPASELFGSAALGVVGHTPQVKAMWLRGGWFDSISALWREVSSGTFQPNDGRFTPVVSPSPGYGDTNRKRNGGSILVKGRLAAGERVVIPIVITWYFPNVAYQYGPQGSPTCSDGGCESDPRPFWQPYYTTLWKDARDVLLYVHKNYAGLRRDTRAFHNALFSSTLPSYVLDAVSANLAIIKSPTVLRQSNGNLWAWEGCYNDRGCCAGSCTHVWNYAQAIPHLFPALERTLREQELERSMDESGHVGFRAALPDGPARHTFYAACDGQLGGIIKLYREWQISGDRNWLNKLYPLAKKSMDYCIETWDPRHRGLVEEPHHNTYDIEFWGPDGMCTSFYLGALSAIAALARDSGHPQDVSFYEDLAALGARSMDELLYNGEYYQQKVMAAGLRDTSFSEYLAALDASSEEARLLAAEGPRYQYGSGCISDGVFGAWLAKLCGLQSPQDPHKVRSNLKAIFAYNFKENLQEHANLQRPGYALGAEPGLLLCTWPHGGKPTLPFVYSDEVWTGIEYQVASHLISEGFIDEGLTIVHATRSRYDGHTRNPWNEYECGSYYARAMASYALLIALSGFRYSAVTRTLHLEPKPETRPFRCFFSTASGWGSITLSAAHLQIAVQQGQLAVDKIVLTDKGQSRELDVHCLILPGKTKLIEMDK